MTSPPNTKRRASKPPRANTFAAFVVQYTREHPQSSHAEVATAARDTGLYDDATPKTVYHARWYYGLLDGDGYRLRAAPSAADGPRTELIGLIKRYGTDAVRAAVEHLERRFA